MEKQLKQTLQDPIQDVSQNTLDDHMLEKRLSNDLQALTLMEDRDNQNLVDTQETRLEVLEDNGKVEEKEWKTPILKYEVAEKEQRLQDKEPRYNIYMSTFSYEGDDLDLNSETDRELEGHAYPFLD